jgi:aryl-alcohol dehydrogenase-like predicted oxidoreductase
MAAFSREHAITLLAYGTLLGGLLSEKYLGRPEPQRPELNTASLPAAPHIAQYHLDQGLRGRAEFGLAFCFFRRERRQ